MKGIALSCHYDTAQPFGHDVSAKILAALDVLAENDRVCLIDLDGHGKGLYAAYKEVVGKDIDYIDGDLNIYRRRTNGPEENFTDLDYRFVVILVRPMEYYFLIRFIADHFAAEPIVILPFVRAGGRDDTVYEVSLTLGDSRPVVVATFPGSGTKRFIPVFHALMWMHGYERYQFVPASFNSRYIARRVDPEGRLEKMNLNGEPVIPEGVAEDYFASAVSLLDNSMWVEFHHAVRTEFLAGLEETRSIYLYRDPRDIITTHYHRLKYDTGAGGYDELKKLGKDDLMMQVIEGYEYMHPQRDFFGRGPSLAEMVKNFCAIDACDNVYGLRYEEIRYRPREAYRDLLAWLGLDQVNLIDLNDGLLDEVIDMGTFRHQSDGQIEEGREATHIFEDGSPIIGRGLRRGISGDWKNHFSPAVKQKFKEIAGEALVELGYEKDLDW